MSLARDDDRVAGPGGGDGGRDRLCAVADLPHLAAARFAAGTGQDLGADGRRVFGARVVVGDDQQLGPGGRGGAHQRALGPVAVAPGAEHDQQPARDLRTQGVEQRGDRGGLVGVVDDRQERLPALDPLHPTGDGDPGEAHGGHRRRHPGGVQAGERDERVRDVERARQAQRDRHRAVRGRGGEVLRAVGVGDDVAGAPVGRGRAAETVTAPGVRAASRTPHSSSTQITARSVRPGANSDAFAAK